MCHNGISGNEPEIQKVIYSHSWTIYLIPVNHGLGGAEFKRKWVKLLSGSDPPSAWRLALFRNMYGFRSKPRKASGGLLWRLKIKSLGWLSAKATHQNVCILTCQSKPYAGMLYVRLEQQRVKTNI